jgi:outer membrane protein assembly factor BamB
VDLPPTIHRGLALFGCHAGYVYALSADSGELAWRFRAAPIDERIVAYGQIESAWPVAGSVLVRDNTAYFAAGRQQLADGGVLIFALNPLTGKKQWVYRLDHMPQKGDPTGKNPYAGFYENSGLEFDPIDILHEEGVGIAMSRWIFSTAGKLLSVDKWNAFAKLNTGGGTAWVPRGSWTYGARHQDRFRGEAPRRPLVVFRDGTVYGQLNASTDIFRRDFDAAAVKKFNGKWITGWAAAQAGRKGGKPFRTYRVAEGAKWVVDAFIAPEDKATPIKPGTQLYNDIHALALAGNNRLYAVHKDGRLKVFNTATGAIVTERRVPAPMWDGLAIARGKIFLSTKTGEVICLGNEAK